MEEESCTLQSDLHVAKQQITSLNAHLDDLKREKEIHAADK